jgi:hypothetical protein
MILLFQDDISALQVKQSSVMAVQMICIGTQQERGR